MQWYQNLSQFAEIMLKLQRMNEVFLSLGSNQGNREANLLAAGRRLGALLGKPVRTSGIYSTKAWGKTDQPDFLNQVLSFRLAGGKEDWLLARLNETERALGRVRNEKWEPRIIDIDILFSGDRVIHSPSLIIPHPFLHLRRFVLAPLHEIAPELIHPVLKKTIRELLMGCEDNLQVRKLN